MTDKVHPSFSRRPRSRETAQGAIAYGGGLGDTGGVVWPSSSRLVEDSEGDLATGALDAFAETSSAASLTVTIGTGEALIGGAYLARDVTTDLDLPANDTTDIYIGWKDGQTDTVLIGEDVVGGVGDAFDDDDARVLAYTFATDGTGVTGVTDHRILADDYRFTSADVEALKNFAGGEVFSGYPLSAADLGTDSVGTDEVQTGAVGTDEVADGSLARADLAFAVGALVQTTEPTYEEGLAWLNPDTGVLYLGYDAGDGGDFHPVPPVAVTDDAQTFVEDDVELVDVQDVHVQGDGRLSLDEPSTVEQVWFHESLDVSGQTTAPHGSAFSPDGLRFFLVDDLNDRIHEYELTEPWILDTATHARFVNIGGTETGPLDVTFGDSGNRLYVVGTGADSVHEWTLDDPYRLSGLTFQASFSVATETTNPRGFAFKPDGTGLVVNDTQNLHRYTLGTPWDISTAAFANEERRVREFDHNVESIDFNDDGSKLYTVGRLYHRITAFNLPTNYEIGAMNRPGALNVEADTTAIAAATMAPDGSKLYLVDRTDANVLEYTLSTPYEIHTGTLASTLDVSGQDITPESMDFADGGSRMYVTGNASDLVYQYSLSTPYDISTASFVASGSVDVEANGPHGIAVKEDGTTLFVAGGNDVLIEYSLGTPYDITTITHVLTFSTGDQNPRDIDVGRDGKRILFAASRNDQMRQLNLGTAWDLSTSGSTQAVDIRIEGARVEDPWLAEYGEDGQRMIVGNRNGWVFDYALDDQYDLQDLNAPLENTLDIGVFDGDPSGIEWRADGRELYLTGFGVDEAHRILFDTAFALDSVTEYPTLTLDRDVRGFAWSSDGLAGATTHEDDSLIQPWKFDTAYDVESAAHPMDEGLDHGPVTSSNERSINYNGDGSEFYVGLVKWDVPTPYRLDSVNAAVYESLGGELDDDFFRFNSDGTKAWVMDYVNPEVHEYTLSTPYDVTTATLDRTATVPELPGDNAEAFDVKPDGAKLYLVDAGLDAVLEYDMTTPGDVSTLEYVQKIDTDTFGDTPRGLRWAPDGSKLYMTDDVDDLLVEFEAGTPWDLSSLTVSVRHLLRPFEFGPDDIAFSDDGTRIHVAGGNEVETWVLDTAYELSTAKVPSAVPTEFVDTDPESISFDDAGERFHLIGSITDTFYQFSLPTPDDVTSIDPPRKRFNTFRTDGTMRNMVWGKNGTRLYMIGSEAGHRIHQYNVGTPYDIHTAVKQKEWHADRFAPAARGIDFKDDGTAMYLVGTTNDEVVRIPLNTAWEIDTADVTDTAFGLGGRALAFNDDGTKYFQGNASSVVAYTLGTPYDLTTAIEAETLDISAQNGDLRGLTFNGDGTVLFTTDRGADEIESWTLTEPYNLEGATFDTILDVTSEDTNPAGVAFNGDGTKMFVVGWTNDNVYEYDLSTAYDQTSATLVNTFDLLPDLDNPRDIEFNGDGTKMFIGDATDDAIYEFALGTPYDTTTATQTDSFAVGADIEGHTFSADGTVLIARHFQFSLATGFDVSTVEKDSPDTFSVSGQDTAPVDLQFGTRAGAEGTRMYILGDTNDDIYQYDIETAWDITTATFDASTDIGVQDTAPESVRVANDGAKLYLLGRANDTIFEWDLSTPHDVTTKGSLASSSVTDVDNDPRGFTIAPDGEHVYLSGLQRDDLHQLRLYTPFDITTERAVPSFDPTTEDASPLSFTWKPDGTKLWIGGTTNDRVYQYLVSTPWDLSTATVDTNLAVVSEGIDPRGIAWSPDGTTLFVVDGLVDALQEYDVPEAWDVRNDTTGEQVILDPLLQRDPRGVDLRPNGRELTIAGRNPNEVLTVPLYAEGENSGEATVRWIPDVPDSIYAWDLVSFRSTPDGETVAADVLDENGNVVLADITRNENIFDVATSVGVRIRARLSRSGPPANPTFDYAARRWVE